MKLLSPKFRKTQRKHKLRRDISLAVLFNVNVVVMEGFSASKFPTKRSPTIIIIIIIFTCYGAAKKKVTPNTFTTLCARI